MLKEKTIDILVMGAAKSGKSTFIESLCGSRPRAYQVPGIKVSSPLKIDEQKVVLYEMPGFDNYVETEGGNLKLLVDFLVSHYRVGRKLHGIIFTHRITDYRTGTISRNHGPILKKLCGEDCLKNVVVVTTGWDDVTEEVGRSREYELSRRDYLFKTVLENGAKMIRHDNSHQSVHGIVRKVASYRPMVLRIQREMAQRRKELRQSALGKHLRKELDAEMKKHLVEATGIEEKRRALMERRNGRHEDQLRKLEAALEEVYRHIDRANRIMNELERGHADEEDHAAFRRLMEDAHYRIT